MEVKKQSFVGFRVVNYNSRTVKEDDRIKVTLEANVEDIGGGGSIGEFLQALQHHLSGSVEVGLSLFVQKDETTGS